MTIVVAGTTTNNGTFLIALLGGVTDTVLTLAAGIVNEGPISTGTIDHLGGTARVWESIAAAALAVDGSKTVLRNVPLSALDYIYVSLAVGTQAIEFNIVGGLET
jgi:hypothetical protein